MRRVIYDQHGGIVRHVETTQDGATHYVATQDIDAIVAANARDAAEDQRRRQFRLAARIPLVELDKLLRSGAIHDTAYMRRFLNDPDNKRMRVWQGRI